MSDVAQPLFLVPAGEGFSWLTVAEFCNLTGMNDGHARRKCDTEYRFRGQAKKVEGEWRIRSDADPRASATATEIVTPPIASLHGKCNKQHKDKALFKLTIVQRWRQRVAAADVAGMSRNDATDRFLADLKAEGIKGVSRPTLYNWSAAIDRAGSVEGLIDGRAVRSAIRAQANAGDPFLERVARYYLDDRRFSIKKCYAMAMGVAEEHGWTTCSYETAYRYIQSLDRATVIRKREGEKAYVNKVEPYIERDYTTLHSNQMWNVDHHIFDVMVKVGERIDAASGQVIPVYRRPYLTAIQDMRSRLIVGWRIQKESPCTATIIHVLDKAIEAYNVPETFYSDNGKDFLNKVLTGQTRAARWKSEKVHVTHDQQRLGGIYASLGIQHIPCWPYHGQSKPIERFFRRVEEDFGKTFETYTGPNAIEKPERLVDKLGKAPTIEEFIAQFGDWVEHAYHALPHQGDGMGLPPERVYRENLQKVRVIRREDRIIALQPRVGPVVVRQNGVWWQGIGYGASEEKIYKFFGKKVWLRLSPEIQSVTVWTEDDLPICTAKANQRLSPLAIEEDKRAAIAEKRTISKTLRKAREFRGRLHEDLTDATNRHAMQRAAAERAAAPQDNSPPPSLMPVRTPIDGASEALASPLPLKKAVGDDTPHSPHHGFAYQSSTLDQGEDAPAGFFYQGGSGGDGHE